MTISLLVLFLVLSAVLLRGQENGGIGRALVFALTGFLLASTSAGPAINDVLSKLAGAVTQIGG